MPECPQCCGPGVLLGALGNTKHFRCRFCGWDFSKTVNPRRKLTLAETIDKRLKDEYKELSKADPDKRFTRGIIHGRIEALEEMKRLLVKA